MKSDPPASDSFAELEKQLERCSQQHRAEPCASLRARIRSECTRDMRCKRRMPRAARFFWSIVFIAAGIVFLGGGTHSLQAASRALLIGAAAWSLVLGFVLFVGLGSAPGTRPAHPLRCALLLALPAVFLIGLALFATNVLSAGEFFGRGGATRAMPCSLHGFASGTVISAAILLLWRRTDPFSPGLTGALVGLVGGLAGAIGVSLACPSTEGWHLWIGHGLAVVGVVLLGWLIGRRWLPP